MPFGNMVTTNNNNVKEIIYHTHTMYKWVPNTKVNS